MPDDAVFPGRELSVPEALSRLPLEAPDRSAWPPLAERLAARQRRAARPRWPFALAAAAALAALAVLPRLGPPPAMPGDAAPPVVAAASGRDLSALMAESAQLEHLVNAVSGDEVASASATVLGLEFEERLQRLDVALSEPTLDPDDRATLWQRRVDLLREYAGLQGTTQWLDSEGGRYDGALVATY